jgi:hypothetical protein
MGYLGGQMGAGDIIGEETQTRLFTALRALLGLDDGSRLLLTRNMDILIHPNLEKSM